MCSFTFRLYCWRLGRPEALTPLNSPPKALLCPTARRGRRGQDIWILENQSAPPPSIPPTQQEPATLANIRGNTQRVRPVPSHRLLIGIQRLAQRIQGRNRVRSQSSQFVGLILEMQYLLIWEFVLLFMETGAVVTRIKITLIADQVLFGLNWNIPFDSELC